MSVLLEVIDLVKHFPIRRGILGRVVGFVRAVDGVSFSIGEGETLALVGESGSGKTTVARMILGLVRPTSGRIVFMGRDVLGLKGREARWYRASVQAVFQNPLLSLNPRMRVEDIIAEPLRVHRKDLSREEILKSVYEVMERVGLDRSLAKRHPYDLSGGQAQRVAIARAVVLRPRLVVLDEPTSALDVSVQAQILNLLVDLREELGLSYLFISHDLSVVRYISDRVAVMYLGKIVETAETEELFERPLHPYTQALLSAVPEPDPETARSRKRIVLPGEPPSSVSPPTGCRLHPRCPLARDVCRSREPPLVEVEKRHYVACWLYTRGH